MSKRMSPEAEARSIAESKRRERIYRLIVLRFQSLYADAVSERLVEKALGNNQKPSEQKLKEEALNQVLPYFTRQKVEDIFKRCKLDFHDSWLRAKNRKSLKDNDEEQEESSDDTQFLLSIIDDVLGVNEIKTDDKFLATLMDSQNGFSEEFERKSRMEDLKQRTDSSPFGDNVVIDFKDERQFLDSLMEKVEGCQIPSLFPEEGEQRLYGAAQDDAEDGEGQQRSKKKSRLSTRWANGEIVDKKVDKGSRVMRQQPTWKAIESLPEVHVELKKDDEHQGRGSWWQGKFFGDEEEMPQEQGEEGDDPLSGPL